MVGNQWSKLRLRAPFVCLSVVLATLACNHAPRAKDSRRNDASAAGKAGLLYPVALARDADDAARFLAGLPAKPGSPFLDLQSSQAWHAHRLALDRDWGRAEARTLPAMRQFQRRQLAPLAGKSTNVIYPFSGPDALAVTTFFPESPVYVLAGLEPPGTLPTPAAFSGDDLEARLGQVRESVHSQLRRSFFVTREMDRHFRGQVSDGLLAPILHSLVRTGHTILGFDYLRIDDDGHLVERAPGEKTPNQGVAVAFRKDSDQSRHDLFYFSTNLADERLRQNKGFLTLLSRMNGAVSYFKATSYMTHHRNFSLVRERVLTNSSAILQDDSGIPYRFFDPASWTVHLYGSYHEPYGSFRRLRQPDLETAYQTASAEPLAFAIGYGYSRAPSNLLLAVRIRTVSN